MTSSAAAIGETGGECGFRKVHVISQKGLDLVYFLGFGAGGETGGGESGFCKVRVISQKGLDLVYTCTFLVLVLNGVFR